MSPCPNTLFSVEAGPHFTKKWPPQWKRGWIRSSETPYLTVCDRSTPLWPKVLPISSPLLPREWSGSAAAPSLSRTLPFSTWPSWPLWKEALSCTSLPTGGTDPSPKTVCLPPQKSCGRQLLKSLASQPPSQLTLGVVGQVNQRAGNRLKLDVEGR